jgi:hypothetical protein
MTRGGLLIDRLGASFKLGSECASVLLGESRVRRLQLVGWKALEKVLGGVDVLNLVSVVLLP